MSMLYTSNPEYRQSLPIIAEIRTAIKQRIGKLKPTKHYTECRTHGGMTKYYDIDPMSYPHMLTLDNIVNEINALHPGWETKAHFRAWPRELVIHVNKKKARKRRSK